MTGPQALVSRYTGPPGRPFFHNIFAEQKCVGPSCRPAFVPFANRATRHTAIPNQNYNQNDFGGPRDRIEVDQNEFGPPVIEFIEMNICPQGSNCWRSVRMSFCRQGPMFQGSSCWPGDGGDEISAPRMGWLAIKMNFWPQGSQYRKIDLLAIRSI